MTTASRESPPPFTASSARGRRLMTGLGIVMILAGIGAIAFPFIGSLGVALAFGAMLVVAGIMQGVGALSCPGWGGTIVALIVAAVWIVGGVLLLIRPLEGVFVLTVVVAAAFLVEGIVKAILAIRTRPLPGWGWMATDGIAAVVLGALLWWQLP